MYNILSLLSISKSLYYKMEGRQDMDEIELRYFIAVAEAESVSRAAEKLHISQPAVSMMIRKLEDELGAELFERTANRIRLNRTGNTAVLYAKAILHDIEEMRNKVEAEAAENMAISIAFADPGVMWYCMPRLEVKYPKMKFNGELYDQDDMLRLVDEKRYDIIVTPHKTGYGNMSSLPFLSDDVFISVPSGNSLEKLDGIMLEEIPAQPLLCPEIGGYFIKQMERIIKEKHLPITLVKNPINLTSYLIRSTNFLTTISALSKELRNDGSGRKLIPLKNPEFSILYDLVFQKENIRKASIIQSLANQ